MTRPTSLVIEWGDNWYFEVVPAAGADPGRETFATEGAAMEYALNRMLDAREYLRESIRNTQEKIRRERHDRRKKERLGARP